MQVEKTKLLGRAADFCPLCENITPFRVFRVPRETSPFMVAECPGCGFAHEIERHHFRSLVSDEMLGFDALIKRTNPRVIRDYGWMLDRAIMGDTPLPSINTQRREMEVEGPLLIADRVWALAEVLPRRRTSGGMVVFSIAWLAVCIQALFWILEISDLAHLPDDQKPVLRMCLTSPVLSSLILMTIHMWWASRRLWLDRVLPTLRAGLRSVQVTEQELVDALDRLKTLEVRIASRLKLSEVEDILSPPRSPSQPPPGMPVPPGPRVPLDDWDPDEVEFIEFDTDEFDPDRDEEP